MAENIERINDDRIRELAKMIELEPIGTERYRDLEAEYTRRMAENIKILEVRGEQDKAADLLELEERKFKTEKRNFFIEMGAGFLSMLTTLAWTTKDRIMILKSERDGYVGNSYARKLNIPKLFQIKWFRK